MMIDGILKGVINKSKNFKNLLKVLKIKSN